MINEPYEPESENPAPRIPAVKWIVAVSVGVFFLQLTLIEPQRIFETLGLAPKDLPASWWTIVTYMFVHAGPLHLALNMATLWMFGARLEAAWSTRSFVQFYLWCGIGGAIAQLLFARDATLVGASAGVSGVLMAYGLRWPEDRVYLFGFIPTRSRWLVAWMIAINVAIGLSPETLIGWKAHLGGLAFGWLFLNAGAAASGRGRRWVASIPDEPDGMAQPIPKSTSASRQRAEGVDELISQSNAMVLDSSREASARAEAGHQRALRLNQVLDKISTQGLGSLTREERSLLDETSQKLRDDDDNPARPQ